MIKCFFYNKIRFLEAQLLCNQVVSLTDSLPHSLSHSKRNVQLYRPFWIMRIYKKGMTLTPLFLKRYHPNLRKLSIVKITIQVHWFQKGRLPSPKLLNRKNLDLLLIFSFFSSVYNANFFNLKGRFLGTSGDISKLLSWHHCYLFTRYCRC